MRHGDLYVLALGAVLMIAALALTWLSVRSIEYGSSRQWRRPPSSGGRRRLRRRSRHLAALCALRDLSATTSDEQTPRGQATQAAAGRWPEVKLGRRLSLNRPNQLNG